MSIIKSNFILKVVLLQAGFFTLLLCLKPIFHARSDVGVARVFYIHSKIEIILVIFLFLALSFGMCYYILKSDNMIYAALCMGLSLCFLFEISKYFEHLLGFLPHYGDVPIFISIFLSLAAIFVYMCVLSVICLLLRRLLVH